MTFQFCLAGFIFWLTSTLFPAHESLVSETIWEDGYNDDDRASAVYHGHDKPEDDEEKRGVGRV